MKVITGIRIATVAVGIAAVCAGVSACSETVDSGEIVAKGHIDSYTTVSIVGKVIISQYHPESYTITVCERTIPARNNVCSENEVSATEWESLNVGDTWTK